ncbi:MAG: polysaccharide biosynthesis tyrosine autokinase [Gammaproteobacteria bacterium]|nr:polysaccharide biosynthesis tyrosine autokinase [Gammaproteobacteria bacterium]
MPEAQEAYLNYSPHEFRESVDAREMLRAITDGRSWIVAIVTLFISLAVTYLIFAPRTYVADALLRVENEQSFLEAMLEKEPLPSYQLAMAVAQDETQVLRSRAILGTVVDALDLTIEVTPVYFPVIGKGVVRLLSKGDDLVDPPFPRGRGYAWGGEQLEVARFNVPESWFKEEFTLTAGERGSFSLHKGERRLISNGRVGVLAKMKLADGATASLLVAGLRARPGTRFKVTRQSRASAIRRLRDALEVNTEDKESLVLEVSVKGEDPKRLERIVKEIILTYQRLNLRWESREAEQKLNFIETQLPVVKARLEDSEEVLNRFRQEQSSVDFSAEAKAKLQQLVAHEAKLAELRQEHAALRKKYKPKHDVIAALDSQMATVESAIATLNKDMQSLPRDEQSLLRLARDVTVNKEIYLTLLNSAQEQRVAKAGSVGSVRIIDDAMVPDKPAWPKPGIVLPVAVLLGLFVSLATIFTRKSFRTAVDDPDAVEKYFGVPVYASIPHSERQVKLGRLRSSQSKVLATLDPQDSSIESLRGLRTMLFQVAGARNNILMICSPRPGMGKSFVSVNLATVLAGVGKQVLLIDADLRRGKLHEVLGFEREPGVSELVTSSSSLEQVIRKTTIDRLDFISSGSAANNPSDILSDPQFGMTLDTLRQRYDYIILDSSPVLHVADAAIIGRFAGVAVLVLKAGVATIQEIHHTLKHLRFCGVEIAGCLVNDLHPRSYRYVYGSSYAPNAPKKETRIFRGDVGYDLRGRTRADNIESDLSVMRRKARGVKRMIAAALNMNTEEGRNAGV